MTVAMTSHWAATGRVIDNATALVAAASASCKPHYLMNTRPGIMHREQIALLAAGGIPVIGGTRQGLGAHRPHGPLRQAAPLAQGCRRPRPPGRHRAMARPRTINEFDCQAPARRLRHAGHARAAASVTAGGA